MSIEANERSAAVSQASRSVLAKKGRVGKTRLAWSIHALLVEDDTAAIRSERHSSFDFMARTEHCHPVMSTQEMLVEEIKGQPEPVLREVLHYLKFLARQRQEEAWADVLPTREVEQEVLNILDGK